MSRGRRKTKRRSTPARKTAARRKPKKKSAQRSASAKKGWATRRKNERAAAARKKSRSIAAKKGSVKSRKKKRLLAAMAEHRQRRMDQPLGWIERRASMRTIHGGKIWRQIIHELDISARDRERLAELERLEIDLLTRGELHDYLVWMARAFDIDLSDAYRMYLGYEVGAYEAAE
jgi:hypothetical protein